MKDWAENEVNIAIKDCDEYTKNCYLSALKAYKSLCEDGHSGASFSITSKILKRLCDNKPLTPITENDSFIFVYENDEHKCYQCSRKSSLFKDVYKDGTIKYNDIDRFTCFETDNPNIKYYSGFVNEILSEIFPLKFPYSGEEFKVACDTFLSKNGDGDFDHRRILYVKDPIGAVYEINKCYKELPNGEWVEISKEEFEENKKSCL